MPLAVLQNGEIRPLEPLPATWHEGQRLRVETTDDDDATPEEIDRDFALLAELCADSDPADEATLSQTLAEARRQAKEQVRQHLRPNGPQTRKPRAERSVALGHRDAKAPSPERARRSAAAPLVPPFQGLEPGCRFTQGGAALCPGLY